MQHEDWKNRFRALYSRAMSQYRQGKMQPKEWFNGEDLAFLAIIGCSLPEFFDLVEDNCRHGEPDEEAVVAMTEVRRDYFLKEQQGRPSGRLVDMKKLPGKQEALGGVPWLPRILAKAEAKLRGEMPPELMYCCGGDRAFLEQYNLAPAEFLRLVWTARGNAAAVLEQVRSRQDAPAQPR